MDVSRISAVSPRQIDWRKLTAKEIIKYENQGVDVPTQYLQWANSFIQDVSAADKDSTTYEKATSNISESSSNSEVGEGNTDETATEEESETEELTAAQAKREAMANEGISLRKQALILRKDSKESTKAVQESAELIEDVNTSSASEIQELESYMSNLLSEAAAKQDELKQEVDDINNDKSNRSTFDKINKLNQELLRYGADGQLRAATSEAAFVQYESVLNSQSEVIFNAADFGTETVNVGVELFNNFSFGFMWTLDKIIGASAIIAGNTAIKASESTLTVQEEALNLNSENISSTEDYKSQIEAKTGVEANTASNSNDSKQDDESKTEQEKTVEKGMPANDPAIASTNLDEILKRKIRKGESLENPPAT